MRIDGIGIILGVLYTGTMTQNIVIMFFFFLISMYLKNSLT